MNIIGLSIIGGIVLLFIVGMIIQHREDMKDKEIEIEKIRSGK